MPLVESWASLEMEHFLSETTLWVDPEPLGVLRGGSFTYCDSVLASYPNQPNSQCYTTEIQVLLELFPKALVFGFLPFQNALGSLTKLTQLVFFHNTTLSLHKTGAVYKVTERWGWGGEGLPFPKIDEPTHSLFIHESLQIILLNSVCCKVIFLCLLILRSTWQFLLLKEKRKQHAFTL